MAFSGLTQPVAVRFASDGAVFVAEKRGIVKRFSALGDTTPDTVADVRAAVHDYWDRGPDRARGRPRLPRPPVHLRLLHLGSPGALGRQLPDAARARRSRAASSTAGSRASTSTTARRPCCSAASGASSSRATASAASPSAADGALYASAGDGASFNYADERPTAGRPDNPCADPARRGRLAARPGPAHGAATRWASTARSCGWTRTRARRPPATRSPPTRTPTRGGSSPRACATRSGSPSARARASCGRPTSAGTCGRRSTATPPRRRATGATSAGRATRAPRAWGVGPARQPGLRGAVRRDGRAGRTAPYYAYAMPTRSSRTRAAPRAPPRSPAWSSTTAGRSRPSTTAPCSSPTTRATAPGRCCAARTGCPIRRGSGRSSPASPVVDLQVGPGGALFFVDINGRPCAGSGRSPATGPRPRGRPRRPTAGPRRSPSRSTGAARPIPTAARSTYAWDLDGDGAYDDSSAAAPVRVYTAPTAVGLRVRDSSGLEDFAQVRVYAGHPARRGDRRRPPRARRGRSATGSRSAAAARPRRARRCPRARSAGSCGCTTARVAGCHVHPIQTWAGTASGSDRRARPRVPVLPRAAPDGDRGRPDDDRVAAAGPAHRRR